MTMCGSHPLDTCDDDGGLPAAMVRHDSMPPSPTLAKSLLWWPLMKRGKTVKPKRVLLHENIWKKWGIRPAAVVGVTTAGLNEEHSDGRCGSLDGHLASVLKHNLLGAQVWSGQAVRLRSDLDAAGWARRLGARCHVDRVAEDAEATADLADNARDSRVTMDALGVGKVREELDSDCWRHC